MPGPAGPNLGVNYGWADGEDGWGGPMNSNLRGLDTLVQLAVLDKDLAAPPISPLDGDRYIVASSPTGAWAGHAGHVAAFFSGAWIFYVPKEGWISWASDENRSYAYDGAAWILYVGGSADWLSQYLLLAGRSGGQIVGSGATPTGGNVDDVTITGRIFAGNNIGSTAYQANQILKIINSITAGVPNPAIFVTQLNSLTGTAVGNWAAFRGDVTGGAGYTSGTFSCYGVQLNVNPSIPAGVTLAELAGMKFTSNIVHLAGGDGTLTLAAGVRSQITGSTGWAGGTVAIMAGIVSEVSNRNMPVTLLEGFRIDRVSGNNYSAAITEAVAIDIISTFANSSNVSTWYGLRIPTMSGPTTIWGIYQAGTMNSAIAGKTRFGSTATPAHWIDVAAGTTTVAFIRAASGSLLTTAAAGCFEYDGTRIYFTDGTPTRQTLAFLSDSSGGGGLTHNLLSATHPDTTTGTVARGDLVTGQTGTPKWTRLALGAANKFLGSDGTDAGWLDLPPGARSGATSSKFYSHLLFLEVATSPVDPVLRSNGSDTDYSSTPFSGTVDRVSAAVVDIPDDFGTLVGWNLWWTDSTGTAANVEWKFGVQVLTAGGQADGAKNGNVNTIASPGANGKIGVDALSASGFPTMAARDKVALFLKRQGGTDANNNQVQLLGADLVYTRA